jgi:glycosyltransferase involved in cell wall biosynthesis
MPSRTIHLLAQYYRCGDGRRQAEIDECLRRNVANPRIDRVHLLTEQAFDLTMIPEGGKIAQTVVGARLSFEQGFRYANAVDPEGHVVWILANADIEFDGSVAALSEVSLEGVVYAITRHDVRADGTDRLVSPEYAHGSQDAWVFRTPVPVERMSASFALGIPGCDHRIAHEFAQAGYQVLNPARTIRLRHHHRAEGLDTEERTRRYGGVMNTEGYTAGRAVPPPYRYGLYPTEALSVREPEPIRVLFVSHSASLAGAERCLLSLLRNSDLGIVRPVVVLPADGPLKFELERLRIQTHVLPLEWWVRDEGGSLHFAGHGGRGSVNALRDVALAHRPDVVHTNSSVVWQGAFVARELGIPHLWHVHEILDAPSSLQPVLALPLLCRLVDQLSASVVAVSRSVRDSLSRYMAGERIALVYNGIETPQPRVEPARVRQALRIPSDAVVALTVAPLLRNKGLDDLIEAAADVCRSTSNIHFVLAGPGTERLREEFGTRRAVPALQGRVHALGLRTDVPDLMAAADMLVVPSIRESFSLVTAEALAVGRPVITTDCGGPTELVRDGETGSVVPVHDPSALAARIMDFGASPQRLRAMGDRARETFPREFTADANAKALLELYRRVLAEHRAHERGAVAVGDGILDGILRLYQDYSDRERDFAGLKRVFYGSASWRLTAPLRAITRLLHR